ncbi:MAG TPA: ankyrin repeat domain-containing protein, partial [Gammaproteobacteria bacterium]|nr:ankyrin repeat domain-containing protein [Gammaproteobacteria bacterium]
FPDIYSLVNELEQLQSVADLTTKLIAVNKELVNIIDNMSPHAANNKFYYLIHFLTYTRFAEKIACEPGLGLKFVKRWQLSLEKQPRTVPTGLLMADELIDGDGEIIPVAVAFQEFYYMVSRLYFKFIKVDHFEPFTHHVEPNNPWSDNFLFKYLRNKDDYSLKAVEQMANNLNFEDLYGKVAYSIYGLACSTRNATKREEIKDRIQAKTQQALYAFLLQNGFRQESDMQFSYSMQQAFTSNDLNGKNAAGHTPLTLAISQENTTIALALLVHNAHTGIRGPNNELPIELAYKHKLYQVANDIAISNDVNDEFFSSPQFTTSSGSLQLM